MGPITLFDKSFLQSLSIDESVWLNQFFLCNICPLFYIETLADLEKKMKNNRKPEDVVGNIAIKFPESGMPNTYHIDACLANLYGNKIPMTGQILISESKQVRKENKKGFVVEQSDEAESFMRWQDGEFLKIEKDFAKKWRRELSEMNLEKLTEVLTHFPYDITSLNTIEAVYDIVYKFLNNQEFVQLQFYFAKELFSISYAHQQHIIFEWAQNKFPSINDYAPYASYVLSVDLFFLISMKRGFISDQRNSNSVDMSYLKYLPFSHIFISSDKLHRRTAKLFMREDQKFVWGKDLKSDLTEINNYYLKVSEESKCKGINFFASMPPPDETYLTTRLWLDILNFKVEDLQERKVEPKLSNEMWEEVNAYEEDRTIDFNGEQADFMTIKHKVNIKKGSWQIIPIKDDVK